MVPKQKEKIDFSFIPSLKCNIECPFCMYDSSPNEVDILNYEKTVSFVKKIDWDLINQVGFYGGEPSINLPLYQKFMDLIPSNISRFIISNGTWSISGEKTLEFINFLKHNKLFLIVSGTPYHKKHQDINRLLVLKEMYCNSMRLKGDDVIHPMGRAFVPNWSCTKKCLTFEGPIRLGLFPNGDILFQNCDGVYPIVQTYLDPFVDIIEKVNIIKNKCVNEREEENALYSESNKKR